MDRVDHAMEPHGMVSLVLRNVEDDPSSEGSPFGVWDRLGRVAPEFAVDLESFPYKIC